VNFENRAIKVFPIFFDISTLFLYSVGMGQNFQVLSGLFPRSPKFEKMLSDVPRSFTAALEDASQTMYNIVWGNGKTADRPLPYRPKFRRKNVEVVASFAVGM